MRRRRKSLAKLGFIFIILLFILASVSISYSLWSDMLYIEGTVSTGIWAEPQICIRKILDGSYTDPYTGDNLTIPNYEENLIHIASYWNPGFPTKFKLFIEVNNSGGETYTNIVVTDTIQYKVAPREWTPSTGSVSWINYGFCGYPWDGIHYGYNELTWCIGTLESGETATLEMWIETLQNPFNWYAPTSVYQCISINPGATLSATNLTGCIQYITTEGIDLDIDPYNLDCNIGIIGSPQLPFATPWVCIEDD